MTHRDEGFSDFVRSLLFIALILFMIGFACGVVLGLAFS